MFHLLGFAASVHDLPLIAVSVALCIFASVITMSLLARARANSGFVALCWTAGTGIVAGGGIWGTHFVAMLAFEPGFPIAYDILTTALSVIIAIVMSIAGFALALKPSTRFINAPVLGGAVTGSAIAAMHHMGLSAIRAPATMEWNEAAILTSMLIGVALTALAFWLAMRRNDWRGYALAAGAFSLAICAIHFTGLSAVSFHFDPRLPIPSDAQSNHVLLAFAVAASVTRIVALGLVGVLIDKRLAQRNEGEAKRLRTYVTELEATRFDLEGATRKLRVALATAASASQAKSEFLASMSHELRTPLNAIIGFSEVMEVETFGPLGAPRYKEYAHDIHDSGKHLLALINDILDVSRLDAGGMTLDERDFNLHDVIMQALKMISRQARGKSIELVEHLAPALPLVHADERRIKQVLINLLANAIKFTPRNGSITVNAWLHEAGLSVAVTDTGVGIAPENIAKALEPFSQIDSSVAREHGGAGLGLPLSSQLMQLHGGTLTLESTLHVGTTVTVTLPPSRLFARQALSAAE